MRKYNSILALILTQVLLAAGCSGSQSPAPATPPPVVKPAIQPIASPQPSAPDVVASAELKKPEYTYRPEGRRDPFAPIIVREEKKEKRLAASPLERYDLSEFKLTGIVWGGFGFNAVVEGPDGKGYFVRVGTVIGQNGGVIRKITKDSFIVEEKYRNYLGVTERKEITVSLRKSQEGLP